MVLTPQAARMSEGDTCWVQPAAPTAISTSCVHLGEFRGDWVSKAVQNIICLLGIRGLHVKLQQLPCRVAQLPAPQSGLAHSMRHSCGAEPGHQPSNVSMLELVFFPADSDGTAARSSSSSLIGADGGRRTTCAHSHGASKVRAAAPGAAKLQEHLVGAYVP